MRQTERYRHFIDYFTAHFPEPETELTYANPYELIVAVVLSAQCTDKRVNLVTPALLAQFPTPAHLAAASAEEVFPVHPQRFVPQQQGQAPRRAGQDAGR